MVPAVSCRKFRKKNKGILPIVSIMPRDNHSVMQLYLDGFKHNFFTFFMLKKKILTDYSIIIFYLLKII